VRRLTAVVLAAALAVSGCGDSEGEPAVTAGSSSTTPPATSSSTTRPETTTRPEITTTALVTTTSTQATTSTAAPEALVAGHLAAAVEIPPEARTAAAAVIWAYGSTSHGTQVWTGAGALGEGFSFAAEWRAVPAAPGLRMAYDDGWSWDAGAYYDTAAALLADAPQANAFMWSWCGELSWDTTAVDAYLAAMARLEADYPGVTFVYMTGHTDGPADQVLEDNNQAIRDYAAAHGKPLYDFADIESWDPAGTHYPNTDDSCPWCGDWCASHPEDCPDLVGECAHSHPFNCILKGRALWWLSARLGGWAGE